MSTELIRSNSLTDLAARIKIEHEASLLSMKRGLEHAIAAGNLLIEAKAQLKHGQWLPWLREVCQSLPERTASLYMRLARNLPELEKSATVADLTVRGALAALTPPTEGEIILERMKAADAAIAEAVEDQMLWQRQWAEDFYGLSAEDREAVLQHPNWRHKRSRIPRWRNIDDDDIAEAIRQIIREVELLA